MPCGQSPRVHPGKDRKVAVFLKLSGRQAMAAAGFPRVHPYVDLTVEIINHGGPNVSKRAAPSVDLYAWVATTHLRFFLSHDP